MKVGDIIRFKGLDGPNMKIAHINDTEDANCPSVLGAGLIPPGSIEMIWYEKTISTYQSQKIRISWAMEHMKVVDS